MKKITVLLLSLCWFSVNATIWRVNSNPQLNADFSSLQEAIWSAQVEEGDTLYIESGSFFGDISLGKSLTLIGPGYFLQENEQTYAHAVPALIQKITITADGSDSHLIGLTVIDDVELAMDANDVTIERSHAGGIRHVGWSGTREGLTLKQCFIDGDIDFGSYLESSAIHNNIIMGRIILTRSSGVHQIYNNAIYYYATGTLYALTARNSNVYNNIIIREPVDINPNIDRSEYCINFEHSNNENISVYNNIMSQSPSVLFPHNLYNQVKEDIFVLEGTTDKQWELKEGSPAIGYGTNGDDCGAYGGVIIYIPSGLPFMIPRIIEATIPSSGSGNVLPVHIKAKTQEE